jgi:hypothetical protein
VIDHFSDAVVANQISRAESEGPELLDWSNNNQLGRMTRIRLPQIARTIHFPSLFDMARFAVSPGLILFAASEPRCDHASREARI